MVEWKLEHRIMVDFVNDAISRSNFEGLKDWFKSLSDSEKRSFKAICLDKGLDHYRFAEVVSDFYDKNPEAILDVRHHNRMVDWLFAEAWYCDRVSVHRSLAIIHLIDEILKNRMRTSSELSEAYLVQRVSLFEPLLTNLIKYDLYDDAWDIASSCYQQISDKKVEVFVPWQKKYIRHLARIGRLRGKYGLKLTSEMKNLALEGLNFLSSDKKNLKYWEKSQ